MVNWLNWFGWENKKNDSSLRYAGVGMYHSGGKLFLTAAVGGFLSGEKKNSQDSSFVTTLFGTYLQCAMGVSIFQDSSSPVFRIKHSRELEWFTPRTGLQFCSF